MAVAEPIQSSLDRPLTSVFPLPLTAFEFFMVADDTAEYSMMADLEMQVLGQIDRAAFDSALRFAIQRNPLFTCLIERDAKGRMAWVPTYRMPEVEWVSLDAPLGDRYGVRTDLTQEIGLRIWVRSGAEQSAILLHFHHACSDGIGAFGFFEDLLAGYALAYPGAEPVTPRPLEPERLAHRGEVGLAGRGWKRKLVDAIAGAREGIKFFVQRPIALAFKQAQATHTSTAHAQPDFITRVCASSITAGLRRAATVHGGTVNDVLMRDLFLVLQEWNRERGCKGNRNLRILMPQNLRERPDSAMPAANVMSFAFVTRRSSWCDRPNELLGSIHEETEAVRRGKLSLYFTGALASLQSSGLMRWALKTPMCFATVVLTNISDPTRRFTSKFPRSPQGLVAGNLVMRAVVGVPPLRPRTRAAFCLSSIGDDIFVNLKCDARYFSPNDAQELLASYLNQLGKTAASADPPVRLEVVEPAKQ